MADGMKDEYIKALEETLADCAEKLRQMSREFMSVRFTDRHGDGPHMLELALRAEEILRRGREGRR